eukprot:TRINITY_DN18130_c0_g1_i2.p1 TRINITY_DN18130_c0_g1~~TRINITY_DN18130_c0_g1_i2.p1  ORF type:complete len:327 (-),score=9.64 TRINITY_DN18130_c0_g1_i2:533-1513(-)
MSDQMFNLIRVWPIMLSRLRNGLVLVALLALFKVLAEMTSLFTVTWNETKGRRNVATPCGFQPSEALIPKVIYQTWVTSLLPGAWESQWKKSLAENPGWRRTVIPNHEMDKFVLNEWRDEPDVVWAYEQINWMVAKVDLFRYLWLYRHGGVYIDADDYLTGNLDTLIGNGSAVLSYVHGELNPSVFLYCKGHPFLRAAIDQVVSNIKYNMWPDHVGRMMGPSAHAAAVFKSHKFYFGEKFPHPSSRAVTFQTTCLQYRLSTSNLDGVHHQFPNKIDVLYKSNNLTYYWHTPKANHLRKGSTIANFLKTLHSNPRWAIGNFNPNWFA